MKWQALLTSVVLAVLIASTAHAQCSQRRGGGSPPTSTGPFPQLTSTATGNSYGNPYASPYSSMARQQRAILAQQQLYRQALAQQQRRRSTSQTGRRSTTNSTSLANSSKASKRDRLRQENAQKAFAVALKAELSGKRSKAEDYYRRVIRIVGSSSELGTRAETSIATLSAESLATGETMQLASIQ